MYPQVVLIDRKGMIRAQSDLKGSPELQDLVDAAAEDREAA